MRFPWLQVDSDFIAAHAGDLGATLGISRREAMGLALDLWTWALARSPDDRPPDGLVTGTGAVPDRLLSGSVGWTGPAEEFSAALVSCGLAEKVADGYRLRGFSRYRATWEKNRRRPGEKPDRNRTGTGPEPERKTQTQTHREDLFPSAADAPKPRKRPKAEKATDPRHAPLVKALVDACAEATGTPYGFRGGQDARHVTELLRLADQLPACTGEAAGLEVVRRWRIGLAWRWASGEAPVQSLGALVQRWNECRSQETAPSRHTGGRGPAPPQPPSSRECAGCGEHGEGGRVGEPGVWLGYRCGCFTAFTEAQDEGLEYTQAAEWAETRRRAA